VVPPYLDRIPLVASLTRRELRAYERRHGRPVDFSKGWWHPPVTPEDVLMSEATQITSRLELTPFVSITDHDNTDAVLMLEAANTRATVPLSFEWTVPYGHGFFHLGVHNLPQLSHVEVFDALEDYTRRPSPAALPVLLDRLNADPHTLVVFNHPLWDLAGIGHAVHADLVQSFLRDHAHQLHAIELNGYRSWRENRHAMKLAEAWSLPFISGGDRHGCEPNSLLNLTHATSFPAFVAEVRGQRRSTVVVMPQYREALVARKLGAASDAVRAYPARPPGQRHWTDRVAYERDGVIRPLSDHWPDGGPLWVRSAIALFDMATRAPFLPASRLCVWLTGASSSDR